MPRMSCLGSAVPHYPQARRRLRERQPRPSEARSWQEHLHDLQPCTEQEGELFKLFLWSHAVEQDVLRRYRPYDRELVESATCMMQEVRARAFATLPVRLRWLELEYYAGSCYQSRLLPRGVGQAEPSSPSTQQAVASVCTTDSITSTTPFGDDGDDVDIQAWLGGGDDGDTLFVQSSWSPSVSPVGDSYEP